MKHILVIAALTLATSYESPNPKQSFNARGVEEFSYKGHSYIKFGTNGLTNNDWSGVVHNPDCNCFKKK